jgi:hypothetical protein
MPHGNSRNVFLVVAGGNPAAERHFEDTIQRKRTLDEVRRFLPTQEIENLEKIYHSSNFIVWGAVPATAMDLGDGTSSPYFCSDVVVLMRRRAKRRK